MNRSAGVLALSLARAASRGEVIPAGLTELQPESVSEVLVRNRAHVIVYRRLEEQGGEAKQSSLDRYLRSVVIEEGVRMEERGKLCLFVAEAMTKAGVPFELNIYERGPHGFGLGGKDPMLSTWPQRCADWLRAHGFISRATK